MWLLLLLEKDPDRRHMWRQETCVDVDLYLKLWICFLHPYLVPAQEQTLDVKCLGTNLFRLWQFQTQIGCHDHAILVSNNLRFHKKICRQSFLATMCFWEISHHQEPTTSNFHLKISTWWWWWFYAIHQTSLSPKFSQKMRLQISHGAISIDRQTDRLQRSELITKVGRNSYRKKKKTKKKRRAECGISVESCCDEDSRKCKIPPEGYDDVVMNFWGH